MANESRSSRAEGEGSKKDFSHAVEMPDPATFAPLREIFRNLVESLRMNRLQKPIGGNLSAQSLHLGVVEDHFAERGELDP